MPKWLAPALILFLAFFILSNPEQAGPQTRSFFSWLGDQGESAGKFITGLIDDDTDDDGIDNGNNSFVTDQAPNSTGQSGDNGSDVGSFVEDGSNSFNTP